MKGKVDFYQVGACQAMADGKTKIETLYKLRELKPPCKPVPSV